MKRLWEKFCLIVLLPVYDVLKKLASDDDDETGTSH